MRDTNFQDIFGNCEFHAEVILDDQEDDFSPAYAYPGGIRGAWVPGLAVRIYEQANKN